MPVQDVTLKGVDVPFGFETTGEFRTPKAGEWFIDTDGDARHTDHDCRHYVHVILKKTEPDAVKLARGMIAYEERMQCKSFAVDDLRTIAERILAEWEAANAS